MNTAETAGHILVYTLAVAIGQFIAWPLTVLLVGIWIAITERRKKVRKS